MHLSSIYEVFPFDLLYRQSWDIEHVSSQSDNIGKTAEDREVWTKNFRHDYSQIFDEKISKESSGENSSINDRLILDFTLTEIRKIRDLFNLYEATKNGEDKKKAFISLYNYVITIQDEHLKGEKITDKDGIGNLVLLDRHTNRSFHNALYPTKRRIILEANGGIAKNIDGEEKLLSKLTFIPLCTRQVFTKHFSTGPGMSLSAWTNTDFENYLKDIKAKLKFYME